MRPQSAKLDACKMIDTDSVKERSGVLELIAFLLAEQVVHILCNGRLLWVDRLAACNTNKPTICHEHTKHKQKLNRTMNDRERLLPAKRICTVLLNASNRTKPSTE